MAENTQTRQERYAEAIHGEWWSGASDYVERAVAAVIAVADAEQRPADANGAWNPTYQERWEIVRKALTESERDTEAYRAQAERAEATLAKVRAYAKEREAYGRRERTVHSARIASDLLAILDGGDAQ